MNCGEHYTLSGDWLECIYKIAMSSFLLHLYSEHVLYLLYQLMI